MSLYYYSHPLCLQHEMLPGHAERPDRLRAIGAYLEATGILEGFDCREAPEVDPANLPAIHDADYLNGLNALSPAEGLVAVDPDTALCPHSLGAARRAAGAVTDAVRNVLGGDTNRAFCAVRPPGHHAERDAAMGFCLYNSIALGAEQALQDPAVQRVAILDFDVHHGNGTVDIFKDRPEVLVCSSFQHPYYPHRYYDIQRPNIVNTPLSGRNGQQRLPDRPGDGLVTGAGFAPSGPDSGLRRFRRSPTRSPRGSRAGRGGFHLGHRTHRAPRAESYTGGRIVSALEGGYDLDALARSVQAHLEVLSA